MRNIRLTGTTSFLKRLLEDPKLPEKIEAMSPREIMKVIEDVGLEDSGEIVALASSQQLEQIFDIDLWKAQKAGSDEIFDPTRFGTWIEVLLELGANRAAEKLSEMDEDFLILAFSSLVWVADLDWLHEDSEHDPRLEKAMESSLNYELENFVLFSKDHTAWDALLTIVAELNTHHYSFLSRILERCSDLLVDEASEEGGFYEILSAESQLTDDVAYEREKRREAQGFVIPSSARAFLKLCDGSDTIPDKLTPNHLLVHQKISVPQNMSGRHSMVQYQKHRFEKVFEVFQQNPDGFEQLNEQLVYLSNILMSGWDWNGRVPRPIKATEIVLEVCELGLKDNVFVSFPEAFRKGWSKWKKATARKLK